MSQHAETKRHFRLALVQGTPPVAPSALHSERWLRKFYQVLPLAGVPEVTRLVNAFKVGADPEFVFADMDRGTRSDAELFGLKTGIAFGADMNGRLVELRPQASRFALDTLASVLEELRWLTVYKRDTLAFAWRAGAFLYKDGIGGHVHLGRKKGLKAVREWSSYFNSRHGRHALRGDREEDVTVKPQQPEELRRMDLIFYSLTEVGVYNKSQVAARQAGDQHGQQYGLFGDVRMQAHGYEYRAYPSWLDHPLSAYLALVLTKLAAYDPEVLPNPNKMPQNPEFCARLIKNFLAYYKGRDDDAALAFAALARHGFPVYSGDDFKPRWGLGVLPARVTIPPYIPDVIVGHPDTTRELFEYLHNGTPLPPSSPQVTWKSEIPETHKCCLNQIESTRGQRGLGELAFNLFYHTKQPIMLRVGNDNGFVIGKGLRRSKEGLKLAKKLGIKLGATGGAVVYVPPTWREPQNLATTKKFLTTLLPLWTPEMLQAGKTEVPTEAKQRFVGKQIA